MKVLFLWFKTIGKIQGIYVDFKNTFRIWWKREMALKTGIRIINNLAVQPWPAIVRTSMKVIKYIALQLPLNSKIVNPVNDQTPMILPFNVIRFESTSGSLKCDWF